MNEVDPKNLKMFPVMSAFQNGHVPVGTINMITEIPKNAVILLDRRITRDFAPELYDTIGEIIPDLTQPSRWEVVNKSLWARIKFLLFGKISVKTVQSDDYG